MKCTKGYEIQVCKSAAGYYLGTMDEMGCPNCRITAYAATRDDAEKLPLSRQDSVEIRWCCGGKGCIPKEA